MQDPKRKYNILAVDDDVSIIKIFESVGELLENCNIFTAVDYKTAFEIVKNNIIHIIFIDIVFPENRDGGYDIGKKFQEIQNTSASYYIFMSSEKNELVNRLKAYTSGAQDFISKPFDISDIEILIKSKTEYFEKRKILLSEPDLNIKLGLFSLDSMLKTLTIGNKKINLTVLEYKLMEYFVSNSEKACTIQDIIDGVWENSDKTTPDNARTFIYKLRVKIEENPKQPVFIVNSKSHGYIFYPFGNNAKD